jgi:hypothetical protein
MSNKETGEQQSRAGPTYSRARRSPCAYAVSNGANAVVTTTSTQIRPRKDVVVRQQSVPRIAEDIVTGQELECERQPHPESADLPRLP